MLWILLNDHKICFKKSKKAHKQKMSKKTSRRNSNKMQEEVLDTKEQSKNLESLLAVEEDAIQNGHETNISKNVNTYKIALQQALKSSDSDSLKRILSEKDESVIYNTLIELSQSILLKLIGSIIDRLESYPSESVTLLKWLKLIIRENFSMLSQKRECTPLKIS